MRPTSWHGLLFASLLVAGPAIATQPPAPPAKENPVNAPACKAQVHVERGQSPWSGYTGSPEEESAGKKVRAVAITPKMERPPHLEKYQLGGKPLLAIDREKRAVVVSADFFGDLTRADATRLAKGERRSMGQVKGAGLMAKPRDLVLFLLESQLVETYWHLEATLCLVEELDTKERYLARFDGVHEYCTSECVSEKFAFAVELEKATGALAVEGR